MTPKALFPFERYLKYKEKCDRQKRNVNWHFVCHYFRLTEDFMEQHIEDLDWNYVTTNQELSKDFFRRHADKIKWNFITNKWDEPLEEEFVREFRDFIRWDLLDIMKFSLDFRREWYWELWK